MKIKEWTARPLILTLALLTISSGAFSQVEKLSARPNYQELNEKIIVPKCLQCHNDNYAARQVYLVTYEDLKVYSVAGDAEASLLYETLTEKAFTRMPFGKAPLSKEELEYIKAWIVNGMPEK